MEESILNFSKKINDKNFKTFDAFYESDEFANIQNNETKRKIFYYNALKFSSEKNKDIQQLYHDLKKIIDKMENPELQKCDKECYINIINNYLEKIELLICTKNFFMKNEKGKDKENYNNLRDIIKLLNNHYKQKKKCPIEIYENLDDLYNILLIKMKHKIPKEYHNRMNRHLNEFKQMLNDIQKYCNLNLNQIKQEKEEHEKNSNNIIEENEKQNYQENKSNNNSNNMHNKNNMGYNYFYPNLNINPVNVPGINVYPQMINPQNYGNPIINYNNNLYNNQMNLNQISQNKYSKNSINMFDNKNEEEGKFGYNNNSYNLIKEKGINFSNNEKFSFNNESYKHEDVDFADNLIKDIAKANNKNNVSKNNIIQNDMNEFENPDAFNNKLKKSKQFTNERMSVIKSENNNNSNINSDNPYRKEKEANYINNKEINNNNAKNKKIKKSVLERRKNYEKIGKGIRKLDENDF